MPEYLAPGVYVEEVSFRAKSIEGVPTSITGLAGTTRLDTSITEFEQTCGDLLPPERGLNPASQGVRLSFSVHAARVFSINREGITALRLFPDRGDLVWGASPMTSDPEWKYISVRRLFIFLERSIYRGTQWVVFEPNNERLWPTIQQKVSDLLDVLRKNGALLGEKLEQDFLARCDRTSTAQNDPDSGRLICQVGVAAWRPRT